LSLPGAGRPSIEDETGRADEHDHPLEDRDRRGDRRLSITDADLGKLVERVREAAGALMRGEVRRYFELVNEAPDYTLMPPNGGPTRHGRDASPASVEALEEFFAGAGEADLELEQTYASGDLVVLVGVERQHGTVAGLPDQD